MPASEDHVRRYYELVDAEDFEALFELFSDDVVYYRPGQPPIEDMAGFQDFYYEGRPLEDGSHEVLRVVVDDDTAVVQGRFTGRQGDHRVDFGFVDVHEFNDDGLIARRWTYTDRDEV